MFLKYVLYINLVLKENFDEFKIFIQTLAEMNLYYSTNQIDELSNIDNIPETLDEYPKMSSFIKLYMDLSKISNTIDTKVNKDKTKYKKQYFTKDIKNISKLTTDEILNSRIIEVYSSIKPTKIEKNSDVEVVKNSSSFPFYIDESILIDKEINNIKLKKVRYYDSRIHSTKLLNKFSFLRGLHKLVII